MHTVAELASLNVAFDLAIPCGTTAVLSVLSRAYRKRFLRSLRSSQHRKM